MNEMEELREWYENGNGEDPRGVVIVRKQVSPEDEGPIGVPQVTQADLNPCQAGSPQDDIQREIIKRETKPELTTKSDELIAREKMIVVKSFGLMKVIESKLSLFHALAGPQIDDPVKKEGLASDIKTLVNELSEIVGSL